MAIACPDCGTKQELPPLPPSGLAFCVRCDRLLDRGAAWGLSAGIALSLATLALLLAANTMPLMRAYLQGIPRDTQLSSAVAAVWREGWPWFAVMVAAFVIVLPIARTLAIGGVLLAVKCNWRPRWLGRVFRYAENVRYWAMPEVAVLALFVIFMRTIAQLEAEVGPGGWCLIAASALSLVTPWLVGSQQIWQAILPDRPEPENEPAKSCEACHMILPDSLLGGQCPRCQKRVVIRKTGSMTRTAALVVAAYILYGPSYYFAMSYTVRPDGVKQHTIFAGIERLFEEGFGYLGVILFFSSVCIPFIKLVGLTWMLIRVRRPSARGLVLRTRVHRIIHRIGRWSNTGPFVVALNVPLYSFVGMADVHVGRAALPFALVVALTMLASQSFDPRLMWDAAEDANEDAREDAR